MKKLHIDPACVEDVFISHFHFDHIGGLSTFLETNSDVRVYAPVSLRRIRHAREVIYLSEHAQILKVFFLPESWGI